MIDTFIACMKQKGWGIELYKTRNNYTERREDLQSIKLTPMLLVSFYALLLQISPALSINHLACLLSELDQGELEKFEAVLHTGAHTSSVADIINLTQNLDCFEFYPDIENEEDLGRYWAEDLPIPEELKDYFDYKAYGRDISINEGGHMAPGGYVVQTSGDFREYYHGPQDIPAEHKVFSYPQLSIREQMAAYKEMIDGSSKEGFRRLTEKGREER